MSLRCTAKMIVLVAALVAGGCSGGGATVGGTVTFNGKPLEKGNINFMPSDGKGAPVGGPISGGKFSVSKVPTGKCKVLVTSNLAGPAPDSMGESVKKKEKEANVDVLPTDEGNSKEYDIPAGGTTLEITIRTSSSSGPPAAGSSSGPPSSSMPPIKK